jgi:hypothetical protein
MVAKLKGAGDTCWRELLFRADHVLSCFPERETEQQADMPLSPELEASETETQGAPPTPMPLTEIEQRFRAEIAKRPSTKEGRWKAKEQDAFLLGLDPKLPREVVRDLRRRCVPEAWREAGAPAKRPM